MAFTGNNGGATSRGVTKDTVRIGIRFPADPIDFGQAYQFLADRGIHETRADLERTALGLLDYFNATFQFYGRKIEPVLWQGSGLAAQEILGGGQDAANADAIKAATELNVFADASAFTPALRRRARQAGRRGHRRALHVPQVVHRAGSLRLEHHARLLDHHRDRRRALRQADWSASRPSTPAAPSRASPASWR